ncbi:MAG: DUF2284 domain-containing protein [Methanolobus sp.]
MGLLLHNYFARVPAMSVHTCGDTCKKPDMRRFPPEAVGINLSFLLEDKGIKMEYCNFNSVKCIGILLLE